VGKRGPLAKPQAQRQGHHEAGWRARGQTSQALVVLPGGKQTPEAIPQPPKGLDRRLRRAWRAFWESSVAQVASEVDGPIIRRLFELYLQREHALKAVEAGMFMKTPTGVRVNPALDALLKLEGVILRLENEIGVTPMARARLGIAVGDAVLTAAELNRIVKESDDRDDDEDTKLLEEFQPD